MALSFLFVGLGGALGASLRFFLLSFLSSSLVVNILGCFLAGFLYPFFFSCSPLLKQALLVGFLGALTTFSSFSLELLEAGLEERWLFFSCHFVLTNFLTLLSCFLGYSLGKVFDLPSA